MRQPFSRGKDHESFIFALYSVGEIAVVCLNALENALNESKPHSEDISMTDKSVVLNCFFAFEICRDNKYFLKEQPTVSLNNLLKYVGCKYT